METKPRLCVDCAHYDPAKQYCGAAHKPQNLVTGDLEQYRITYQTMRAHSTLCGVKGKLYKPSSEAIHALLCMYTGDAYYG